MCHIVSVIIAPQAATMSANRSQIISSASFADGCVERRRVDPSFQTRLRPSRGPRSAPDRSRAVLQWAHRCRSPPVGQLWASRASMEAPRGSSCASTAAGWGAATLQAPPSEPSCRRARERRLLHMRPRDDWNEAGPSGIRSGESTKCL
jgi:hypothetical protein